MKLIITLFLTWLLLIMPMLTSAYTTDFNGDISAQDVQLGGVIQQKCMKDLPRDDITYPVLILGCTCYLTIRDGEDIIPGYDYVTMTDKENGFHEYLMADTSNLIFSDWGTQYIADYYCIDSDSDWGNISMQITLYSEANLPTDVPQISGPSEKKIPESLEGLYYMPGGQYILKRWFGEKAFELAFRQQFAGRTPPDEANDFLGQAWELITNAGAVILAVAKGLLAIVSGFIALFLDPIGYTSGTLIPWLISLSVAFISSFWVFAFVLELGILGLTLYKNPTPSFFPFMNSWVGYHVTVVGVFLTFASGAATFFINLFKTFLEMTGIIKKAVPFT